MFFFAEPAIEWGGAQFVRNESSKSGNGHDQRKVDPMHGGEDRLDRQTSPGDH